ncbi:MAG: UPF0280 family protein [Desulfococcaceae bacterium]
MKYEKRTYRDLIDRGRRSFYRVTVKETDLYVHTEPAMENRVRELVLQYRGYIESYIFQFPEFARTLSPWHIHGPVPNIIRDMAEAGGKAGVGPMAAVAGAVAEYAGRDLMKQSREVIVENGGDIFLKTDAPVTIAIYAGKSPLSLKVGLRVNAAEKPMGVCTSSGTVGHSLSLGKADAVCAISDSCALADAAATAIGNHARSKGDIQKAIAFGQSIEGLSGLVVIVGDKMGMWGDIEPVPVSG